MCEDELNLIKQYIECINGYDIAILDDITAIYTKNNVTSQNITITKKDYPCRLSYIIVPSWYNLKKIISIGLSLTGAENQFSTISLNLLILLGKVTTTEDYYIIDLPDGLFFRSNRDIELEIDFVLNSHGNDTIDYKIVVQRKIVDPDIDTKYTFDRRLQYIAHNVIFLYILLYGFITK